MFRFTKARILSSSVAVFGCGLYVDNMIFEHDYAPIKASVHAVERTTRSFTYAGLAALDWVQTFGFVDVDNHDSRLSEYRRRTAEKFLHVCKVHGGLYNKFGQYIGSLNSIMPREVTDTLSVLQDRAREFSETEIRRLIAEELGTTVENFCSSFDFKPIGAASIAQVHTAVLLDGTKVVVKLQHPSLISELRSDLLTIRSICLLLSWFNPSMGYDWFYPDFVNSFKFEIDFRQEAFNAERIRLLFENSGRSPEILIPKVDFSKTTKRIMVMEYCAGVKVNEKEKLAEMNLDKQKISTLISRTFGEMLHVHGLLHCDPHPGNLLVRPLSQEDMLKMEQNQHWIKRLWKRSTRIISQIPIIRNLFPVDFSLNPPQLIVLDHGMYRRLNPQVRLAVCHLFRGIISKNPEDLKKAAAGLNVDERGLEALALIFTGRSIHRSTQTSISDERISADDRTKIKQQFGSVSGEELNSWLEGLPRDLIWVIRTILLMRCLDDSIGVKGTGWKKFFEFGKSSTRGSLNTDSRIVEAEKIASDFFGVTDQQNEVRREVTGTEQKSLFSLLQVFKRIFSLWCFPNAKDENNVEEEAKSMSRRNLRKLMISFGIGPFGEEQFKKIILPLSKNNISASGNNKEHTKSFVTSRYLSSRRLADLDRRLQSFVKHQKMSVERAAEMRQIAIKQEPEYYNHPVSSPHINGAVASQSQKTVLHQQRQHKPIWWDLPGWKFLNLPVSREFEKPIDRLAWASSLGLVSEDVENFFFINEAKNNFRNSDQTGFNLLGRLKKNEFVAIGLLASEALAMDFRIRHGWNIK
eukprot:GDKJ01037342.1.p1 GENE.GDKJ01037342.1~~GDKJ01037342.1.p1  ORF type:complete len:806 (-),score=164.87 GDKJ01037342.1:121-2538(-)